MKCESCGLPCGIPYSDFCGACRSDTACPSCGGPAYRDYLDATGGFCDGCFRAHARHILFRPPLRTQEVET